MQQTITGNLMKSWYSFPTFNIANSRLELTVVKWKSYKDTNDEWVEIPETRRTEFIVINNDQWIKADLSLVSEFAMDGNGEPVVDGNGYRETPGGDTCYPAFDFIMSLSPAQMGMTELTEPLYVAMANTVEGFLTTNGLA